MSQSNAPQDGLLVRLSRAAVRHRWAVLAAWVVVAGALGFLSLAFGGRFVDTFTIPGTESQKATNILEERFPSRAGDTAQLVFDSEEGVRSPEARAEIGGVISKARELPGVTGVSSPFEVPGAISEDGNIAYATLQYDVQAAEVEEESVDELTELADSADGGGLTVEVGGQVVSTSEIVTPRESEVVGVAAAAVILLLAFGSVVAMGLPILTALTGLGTGVLIITLVARFTDLSTVTPAFAAMIGIGVGIDYALFVVTRFRESLADSSSVEEAVAHAMDTAGRSVVAAGGVVVISLLGLFYVGIPFVAALGFAAAIVVSLAVLVAVSLLPALFGLSGRNIDRWRVPSLGSGDDTGRSSLAYRLGRRIQRHPVPFAIVAAAFLLLLAVPALDMRLGLSDDGNNPTSFDSRRAYDLLAEGFGPGFNGPLLIAAENDEGSIGKSTLESLSRNLGQAEGIDSVTPPRTNEGGGAAVITAYPTTAPQSKQTADTVENLRQDVIPRALDDTAASAYVGGITAGGIDMSDRIGERMPVFFGLVIGLSFLLLMAIFRSIAVPVKAAAMNLLSIGAAYGVMVTIFQWGWGMVLLGLAKAGPIDAFVPVMLFAVLFGLSTDYEVFLVSRIRESYVNSGDPHGSVAEGLGVSARVITAAAAIMISVFLSFVVAEDRIIKEFGVGLAVAVLLDATVIRLVLVPSIMTFLGRLNWSFPRWLDGLLPDINVEGGKPESKKPTKK